MNYLYGDSIYCNQLREYNGEAVSEEDILNATIGDGTDWLKTMKSDLSDDIMSAIEHIDHEFNIEEKVTHSMDKSNIGTWGYLSIHIFSNRELNADELDILNEYYQDADLYWNGLLNNIKLELQSTED